MAAWVCVYQDDMYMLMFCVTHNHIGYDQCKLVDIQSTLYVTNRCEQRSRHETRAVAIRGLVCLCGRGG